MLQALARLLPHSERYSFGQVPELPELGLLSESQRREWHYPLDQPIWRTADAADHMQADDVVLGLYYLGKAWALPWWIMKNHHVANLTLEDMPLLVTLCEACSSAAAFDPVIDGKRHSFRLAGLYNGTHVIGDFETESIWGSFSGEALHGTHRSFVMERLPLYQCRWQEWRTLHPESLVAHAPPETRFGHGEEHSPGSAKISPGMRRSLVRPFDERLAMSSMVLGVDIDGNSKAYPLERLDAVGAVVNDTVGDHEIVVLHAPGTLMAAAFSRTIGDQVLFFEQGEDDSVVDRQYRAHWSHAGEALDGPLAGQALAFVRSGIEEWYVWAAYHPATTIFDRADDA